LSCLFRRYFGLQGCSVIFVALQNIATTLTLHTYPTTFGKWEKNSENVFTIIFNDTIQSSPETYLGLRFRFLLLFCQVFCSISFSLISP
jgi:hypothetical protein